LTEQAILKNPELRSSVRWIAQWTAGDRTPKKVFAARGYPAGDADWRETMSHIQLAVEAADNRRGCVVAVGLPEEWQLTFIEDGLPWMTVALDRSYDLLGNVSGAIGHLNQSR
jgi:hypothetical protein